MSQVMAAYTQFSDSLLCDGSPAFDCENFIFSWGLLGAYLEAQEIHGDEKGFKCSEFRDMARLGHSQLLELLCTC